MALIKCYECKKKISDLAPVCPHCGVPSKTLNARPSFAARILNIVKKIFLAIGIIVVILIIIGFLIDDDDAPKEKTPAAHQTSLEKASKPSATKKEKEIKQTPSSATPKNEEKSKVTPLIQRFSNISKKKYIVSVYKGKRADEVIPKNDPYQKRMTEALKHNGVFAGHYAMAQFSCGMGCLQIRIVDLITGKIIEPQGLEMIDSYYVGEGFQSKVLRNLQYYEDLSLVYVQGRLSQEKQEGSFVFNFDGKTFHLLEKSDVVEISSY